MKNLFNDFFSMGLLCVMWLLMTFAIVAFSPAYADTITTLSQAIGPRILKTDVTDAYKALSGDLGPRNSSGVNTDLSGSLGASGKRFKKGFIASGYPPAGTVIQHEDFGGTVTITHGWYPMDGTTINEANYDALPGHSAGDWDTYIISSSLDGVATIDYDNRYLVGSDSLANSGDSVGNASHQIAINHAHDTPAHNHKVYNSQGNNSEGQIYDTGGTENNITIGARVSGGHLGADNTGTPNVLLEDMFTSNLPVQTSTFVLSATQSIQPSSFKIMYYVKITD